MSQGWIRFEIIKGILQVSEQLRELRGKALPHFELQDWPYFPKQLRGSLQRCEFGSLDIQFHNLWRKGFIEELIEGVRYDPERVTTSTRLGRARHLRKVV